MTAFVKKYWVLLLVLLVFVIFKIPHLFYPYYWDESWPYAPAIREMLHHGISLMPDAVNPELSRGHPLFFHAIAALWMKIFGSSHFAMHSFSLFISLLFLIAIYETGLRLFNKRVGTFALLLVASQELFFVQSSFVMLEVLVAFLAFLSLVFYIRGHYILTTLCLAALFFTKESGLIMGFVLGLDALICAFDKKVQLKKRLYQLLSIGIPCLLVIVFFLIQKHQRGWYIFPMHSDLIEHSWPSFWYRFRMAGIKLCFNENYKCFYYILLLILAIWASIKNRKPHYLVLILPFILIYYFIDDLRAVRLLPPIPFFIVFIVVLVYFLVIYTGKLFLKNTYQKKYIILSLAFVFCFLCFSSMNFLTYRYLIAAVVPLLIIVAVYTDVLLSHTYNWLSWLWLGIILFVSYWNFKTSTSVGDSNIGAFDGMDVQQGVVKYLEQNNDYKKVIGCGPFLDLQHLTNPATGFLSTNKVFTKVRWEFDANTQLVIFNNMEPDYRYDAITHDTLSFKKVYRITKGNAWAEIYERK